MKHLIRHHIWSRARPWLVALVCMASAAWLGMAALAWLARSVRENRLRNETLPSLVGLDHTGEVEMLLARYGRDPNERMPDGSTPLIYSVRHGYVDMVKLLLRHGAKLDAIDNSGQTAMDWARKNKNDEMLSILTHYESNGEPGEKRPRK